MKTERQIRISSLNDYVAVDLIDESKKIIENVFYFGLRQHVKVLMHDDEERKWIKTNVIFDGEKLNFIDIDPNSDFMGMEYDIKPSNYEEELCDKNNIKPILS